MKEIDKIVKKVLLESLNEKADEITNKIHSKLSGEMKEIGFKQGLARAAKKKFGKNLPKSLEDKFHLSDYEEDNDDMTDIASGEFDYVAEGECMEGDCNESSDLIEMAQDGEDIVYTKTLDDSEKKEVESRGYSCLLDVDTETRFRCKKTTESQGSEVEKDEQMEGNAFLKKLKDTPKGEKFKLGGKTFTDTSDYDGEMEEGNAFTKKLKNTPKGEKFKIGNKTYTDTSDLEESVKYSVSFGDKKIVMTEEEMITMIEEIIVEEKKKTNLKSPGKSKGMVEFDRVHKKDEDINKKANQESFKKMKDYVKAGSKGNFETNPKHFPKGNGELAKMDKKAYTPSDAVEEYIDTFAYGGGMLDLDPDEIGYNEDWLEKTIEGSSMTGNSPEYANADDTGLGKKLNKRRKEGLYNQEKRQGSYKRVKQPVDVAGENTKSGKLNKMFKNLGESEEKENVLSEEMIRMKDLLSYNKKTQ